MTHAAPTCPYCQRPSLLVTGKTIYPHRPDLVAKRFWQCAPCDAYVGCHPPAGRNGKGGQGDGTVPLGRRARSRAAVIEAKHCASVDQPDEPEDDDYSGGPTCPSCGAEVLPEHDECWMCGAEL